MSVPKKNFIYAPNSLNHYISAVIEERELNSIELNDIH